MNLSTSLPDPDQAALQRAERVTALVRAAIEAEPAGAIGFDRFMQIALYAPGLGYYVAAHDIFGRDGDFVTAPESGELFGRCLARTCAAVLAVTGGDIVEYGGGSGRLAVTLLRALRAHGFGAGLRYHLVEPSPRLAARQRALLAAELPELIERVEWHTDHPPAARAGVIVANEVIDAFPARRYVVRNGRAIELGVAIDGDGLVWRELPGSRAPAALAAFVDGYADGYVFEHVPALAGWIGALRRVLHRGLAVVVDYGYERTELLHPSRTRGTLKCHYRHRVHDDPFRVPGLQDLTTAVDFSAVAGAADAAGFRVAGYTTLTRFLLASGVEEEFAAARGGNAAADYALAQEAKRLLLPGEMGETCKVMALAADFDAAVPGFADDRRVRLSGLVRDAGP